MDDHLGKPFKQTQLYETIRQWTDSALTASETAEVSPAPVSLMSTASTPVAPAPIQSVGIDREALLSGLNVGGKVRAELVSKVIALFVADVPELINSIQSGIVTDDRKLAERAAHTLKSTAATVAATELSKLAALIERLIREGRLEEASGHQLELRILAERASTQLCAIGEEFKALQEATLS